VASGLRGNSNNTSQAKFYVLGSNVTQKILALATDDVVVVGYVEDLSHYLDRCRMSVVPLRYGAGMEGKIGTSMSYGVPCVATSMLWKAWD